MPVCDVPCDFHCGIGKGHFKILHKGSNSECWEPLCSLSKQSADFWSSGAGKEGLLLTVISGEVAPCNKQRGIPTTISLNSSMARSLAFGNKATSRTTLVQCIFLPLVLLIEAIFDTSMAYDHPAHPKGFYKVKYSKRGLRFRSLSPPQTPPPAAPGGSLKSLCRFTHLIPFPNSFKFWLSTHCHSDNLTGYPMKTTDNHLHVHSLWSQRKGCKRWVGRKSSPYSPCTKWGPRTPSSGVTEPSKHVSESKRQHRSHHIQVLKMKKRCKAIPGSKNSLPQHSFENTSFVSYTRQ